MAENTTNKDFTKFHSLPVEEWESTIGGKDYEKYLEKAEKRQEIEKLSLDEKHDLDRLKAYKKGSDEKEESYDYDEGSIDWKEIDQPMKVVFYLSCFRIMLSKAKQNIQGFVKSKWKTMSELGIAKYARKKLDLIDKKDEKQNDTENKQDMDAAQQEPKEKQSLWIRFGRYCKECNDKEVRHYIGVYDNRERESEDKLDKKSKNAEQITEKREGLENDVYGDDAQIHV